MTVLVCCCRVGVRCNGRGGTVATDDLQGVRRVPALVDAQLFAQRPPPARPRVKRMSSRHPGSAGAQREAKTVCKNGILRIHDIRAKRRRGPRRRRAAELVRSALDKLANSAAATTRRRPCRATHARHVGLQRETEQPVAMPRRIEYLAASVIPSVLEHGLPWAWAFECPHEQAMN